MKRTTENAFTLVELLVVIAVLGILSTIGLVAFNSSQVRGRDATRKSDLRQIANALELYYNDYGYYPEDFTEVGSVELGKGTIVGCPVEPGDTGLKEACSWGAGQFTDNKTIYMKVVPKDPSSGYSYFYRTMTVSGSRQAFQLYAHLENSQDSKACINEDCTLQAIGIPEGVLCGTTATAICNFSN
jgi:prepilin-type N-terminal cleavage/methylation domain-containing protein